VIDSAKIHTLSLITKDEHGTTNERIAMTSLEEATRIISDTFNSSDTKVLICPKTQTPEVVPSSSLPQVYDQSYLQHRLLTLPKARILEDSFTEITKN
jgi:hypothetical protein